MCSETHRESSGMGDSSGMGESSGMGDSSGMVKQYTEQVFYGLRMRLARRGQVSIGQHAEVLHMAVLMRGRRDYCFC
jgi:ribosomal protein L15